MKSRRGEHKRPVHIIHGRIFSCYTLYSHVKVSDNLREPVSRLPRFTLDSPLSKILELLTRSYLPLPANSSRSSKIIKTPTDIREVRAYHIDSSDLEHEALAESETDVAGNTIIESFLLETESNPEVSEELRLRGLLESVLQVLVESVNLFVEFVLRSLGNEQETINLFRDF